MKWITALLLVFASAAGVAAQDTADPGKVEKTYPFILRASPPRLFTMRQFDEDCLSSYRLFSDLLNTNLNPVVSYAVLGAAVLLSSMP